MKLSLHMPTLATNKRAYYDYEILEKLEAGLKLLGHEVKSAKSGNISLKGSYVTISNHTASLLNAHIGAYSKAGPLPGYDPTRSRPLLVKKRELRYLLGKTHEQGLTLVPLSMYTKRNLVKLEFAVARGKKKFDKREAIKEREWKRRKQRLEN